MSNLISTLKTGLNFYVVHFTTYDYLALFWVVIVFLLILFMVILLITKHQSLSAVFLFLDIIFLFFGTYYALDFVDSTTRQRTAKIENVKQLYYSDTVIVNASIKNESKKPFNFCEVKINFIKNAPYRLAQIANRIKPIMTKKYEIKTPLMPNEVKEIKFIIDNFRPKNYSTIIKSECFN